MNFLRITLAFAIISALMISCTEKQPRDAEKSKKEVANVLQNTKEHFVNKDAKALLNQYADVNYFVDYGDDKNEMITDFAEFEKMYTDAFGRDFDYKKLEMKNTHINTRGEIAWFGTDIHSVVTMDSCDVKFSGRLTGVLENIDGEWKYVMTHYNEFEDDDCCDSDKKEGCCDEKHKDSECCDDDKDECCDGKKKEECCDEKHKKECDDKDKEK